MKTIPIVDNSMIAMLADIQFLNRSVLSTTYVWVAPNVKKPQSLPLQLELLSQVKLLYLPERSSFQAVVGSAQIRPGKLRHEDIAAFDSFVRALM